MKKKNKKEMFERRLHISFGKVLYIGFLCVILAVAMCLPAFAATPTIWEKATEIMKDVYNQILLISTIAAVVCAAVPLLLMNFSKSGKTVDESRAWLKRIAITWAILVGPYVYLYKLCKAMNLLCKSYNENPICE